MCRCSGPDRNGNARPLRGVERAEGQLRFRRSAQTLGPEEIAEAILFIASDKASFISGASIPVNGGKAAL